MPNKYSTFGANYYNSLYSKYLPQYAGPESDYATQFDSWWENMYNKYQGDDQAGSAYFESLANSNVNPFIHMDDTIYPPVDKPVNPDAGNVTVDFWGEYPKVLDYINKSYNEHGYNQYWNVNDYTDYLKNSLSGLGEKDVEKTLADLKRDENPFNEWVTNRWATDESAWGKIYQTEWDKFSQLNSNSDIWATGTPEGYQASDLFKDWFNTNVRQQYADQASGYNPKTWYSLQNINPLELDIYGNEKPDGNNGTGGGNAGGGGSIEPDPFDTWLRPYYDQVYKKYRTPYSSMSDDEFNSMFNKWWRGKYDEYEGKADTATKYFSDLLQSSNFNPFGEEFNQPGAGEDGEPHPDLPPGIKNPGTISAYDASQYQIAIPDELTQAAQNGYGSQWMRAAFETAMSPNIQEYGNTVRSIQNSRGAGGLRSGFGEKDQQMAEYQLGLLGLGAKSGVEQQDYEYRQAALDKIDNTTNYNKAMQLSIDQWNAQQEYSNKALRTYDTQNEALRKALEDAKETEMWGDILGGIGSLLPLIL